MPLPSSTMTHPALQRITPLIPTYNEEANIARTLDRLTWADRVVIIDSHSTDATLELVRRYPNVEVFFRAFDGFAEQCNFGLDQIDTEWVLSMDADYVLSAGFIDELPGLVSDSAVDGAIARFRYCVAGRPLSRDNTTPRKVLYRRAGARYVNLGHQHRIQAPGSEIFFRHPIYHDDRKSLSRWLQSQDRYLTIEARKLRESRYADLDFVDKLRKTGFLGPPTVFLYCLFFRLLVFRGWPGWYYTLQRTMVETLLAIKLIGLSKLDLTDYTTLPEEKK